MILDFRVPFVVPIGSQVGPIVDQTLALHIEGRNGKVKSIEFVAEGVDVDRKNITGATLKIALQRGGDVVGLGLVQYGSDVEEVLIKSEAYFRLQVAQGGIGGKVLEKVFGYLCTLPGWFVQASIQADQLLGFADRQLMLFSRNGGLAVYVLNQQQANAAEELDDFHNKQGCVDCTMARNCGLK